MSSNDGPITGEIFAAIVKSSFEKAFEYYSNQKARQFLMDGCPQQNSKIAMNAINKEHAKVFKIPSRSPDLNPTENFFNSVTVKLNNDALEKEITKESFEELSRRVETLC